MKKALITAFLTILIFSAGAESIRGNTVKLIDLSQLSDSETSYNLGIEQFLAIDDVETGEFLEGFELSIKIPSPLQEYGDSFILMIYGDVTPLPTEGTTRNYQGVELGHKILNTRARQYLNFDMEGESKANTDLPTISADDFPLAFMLLPMSKGVPDAITANPFEIKITPRWQNIGALRLETNLESFDEETLEIWINDEKIRYTGQQLLLPGGIHEMTARLNGYEELNFNFAVKQGKINRVQLPFQAERSLLTFAAPESCVIYLDGERIDFPHESEMEIEKGEHSVLFKLGDYQISKRFSIISGKDYEISLFLDILIEEN